MTTRSVPRTTPFIPWWAKLLARVPRGARYTNAFDILVGLGFWDLPYDGDFYVNGRWCWRWWRGQERSLARQTHFDEGLKASWRRRNAFQRFGWWLERTFG